MPALFCQTLLTATEANISKHRTRPFSSGLPCLIEFNLSFLQIASPVAHVPAVCSAQQVLPAGQGRSCSRSCAGFSADSETSSEPPRVPTPEHPSPSHPWGPKSYLLPIANLLEWNNCTRERLLLDSRYNKYFSWDEQGLLRSAHLSHLSHQINLELPLTKTLLQQSP